MNGTSSGEGLAQDYYIALLWIKCATACPENRPIMLVFEIPTAAYVHIPFCRRRCFYCDFPISVVGDKPPIGEEFGTIAQYVTILCQDIAQTPDPHPLSTVFFGGGTPSLLTAAQLDQILQTLDRHFGIAANAEISMEIDPGTFDRSRLQGYVAAGINRISLGVQAFQPEILQACGRTHTPEDIAIAVNLIHSLNISNFSLDLISGLPHLTLERWQASLEKAIALAPTHLSVYDLTVEAGTSFDRWYEPGAAPLPTDEATAEMYRLAQQVLTAAGYAHYEISNYGRSGYQCQHNRVYWENRSYYGFGMAAASYVNGQRFTRPRKRSEYFQWVETGKIDCPVVSLEENLLDTLMLGLRLAEGVSLAELRSRFGDWAERVMDILQPYGKMGWVVVDPERLRLSDPEGFLFSNEMLATLFKEFSSAV
jgi:putative oxygen-independent coproporphyrinogen III oxidase